MVGGGTAVPGLVLHLGAGSILGVMLTVLLLAVGIDLVGAGVMDYCPLYHRLGHVPRSLRRS